MAAELDYSREAFRRVSVYRQQMQWEVSKRAAGAPSNVTAANMVEEGKLAGAQVTTQVAEEMQPADIQCYLRAQSYEFECRRRFDRFMSKCNFMAMQKRLELYQGVMELLTGGQKMDSVDAADAVPHIVTSDADISAQLDEVAGCFKLNGDTSSQEFAYNVGKRYAAVFTAQCAAWTFQPNELAHIRTHRPSPDGLPASTSPVKHGKATEVPSIDTEVYLHATTWLDALTIVPAQPGWRVAQDTTLRSLATVHPLIRAENDFLTETDLAKSIQRWKERAESHQSRGAVCSRVKEVPMQKLREEHSVAPEDANVKESTKKQPQQSAQQQSLLALYELRFLRVREFRRKVLSALNFFASTHRRIALDCQKRALPHGATGSFVPVAPLIGEDAVEARSRAAAPMVKLTTCDVGDTEIDTVAEQLMKAYDCPLNSVRVPPSGAPASSSNDKAAQATTPEPMDGTTPSPALETNWHTQHGTDHYDLNDNKSIVVINSEGKSIMYRWALEALTEMEERMLRIASYYVAKEHDSQKDLEGATECDFSVILEDLWESECWFVEGKLKIMQALREGYEHATDRAEQSKLAVAMLELIDQVPQYDLTDHYFSASYTREVINLELIHAIMREIISVQVLVERRVLQQVYGRGAGRATADDLPPFYGFPERPIQDSRLFTALMPGTSVVNVLDLYGSLGLVRHVPAVMSRTVTALCERFNITSVAGVHYLKKAVLEEMLVQWRLLGEDEKLAHSLQTTNANSQPLSADDTDAFHALNDVEGLDVIVQEICAEADSPSQKSSFVGTAGQGSGASEGSRKFEIPLPEPSPAFRVYMNCLDVYHVRAELMASLYDTEILYNVHRRQAKIMGISVKKTQLEGMDFETRRTYAEIDEAENLRDLGISNNDAAAVFADVSMLKVELLTNLAIAEFEQSMARFDMSSKSGVRKLLAHDHVDFRRALTAQVTQRNMLVAITLCNQVPIDQYLETLAHRKWDPATRTTFVTQAAEERSPSKVPDADENHLKAAKVPLARCRIGDWPWVKEDEMDRTTLQKLYISVNQVKSAHRKCILQEMNVRTQDVLNTKKPELLRRKMRELKNELVHEYCLNMMMAVYQYAAKYQLAVYSMNLRRQCALAPPLAAFYTIGLRSDVVRPQPRSVLGAAQAEAVKRMATCMITRNGKIDDARYLPHYVQLLQLDYDVKDPRSGLASPSAAAPGAPPKDLLKAHEHVHSHGQSHIRTNFLLTCMATVLHHWVGISELLKSQAACSLQPYVAMTAPSQFFDQWRGDLAEINNELEALKDPTDLSVVLDFLSHRHSATYLRHVTATNSLCHLLLRQNAALSAQSVREELSLLQHEVAYESVPHERFDFLLWPLATLQEAALKLQKRQDAMSDMVSLLGPIQRIKRLRINGEFEACVVQIENTPANAFAPTAGEKPFFDEVEHNSFPFVGAEVSMPYRSLRHLFVSRTLEERDAFLKAIGKADAAVEEAADDTIGDAIRTEGEQDGEASPGGRAMISEAHYEVLSLSVQRDSLRELYFTLARQNLITETSEKRTADMQIEDLYTRNVLHKANTLADKEQHGTRYRKRARTLERDQRRMQVAVLITEINKILIGRTANELRCVLVAAERQGALMESATPPPQNLAKTTILTEFINVLMARAVCVREEGDKLSSYHIPEQSLNAALDTVGRKLKEYQTQRQVTLSNVIAFLVEHYQLALARSDQRAYNLEYMRNVDAKALQRRVQAKIADTKFDLLFCNENLEKENALLRHQIRNVQQTVREEAHAEHKQQIAELESRLLLVEGQFQSYRKKLYFDMQKSLEEIKRGAMLSVGKMESAPLHMKRQALKIAISDDEINLLKEQNSELRSAVVKTKLWYEMKMLRMEASFRKQLQQAKAEVEESRSRFWKSKENVENEKDELKQQLTITQNLLSQSEIEVEQLRKDLQLQLCNKKDLVQWKVQHSKKLEELQKRIKKFEKLESYDLDKIIGDFERRQQQQATPGAQPISRPGTAQETSPRTTHDRVSTAQTVGRQSPARGDLRALQEKLERERKLKERAFAKLDELRQGDTAANEALVWQRKYFEAATELQRCIKELENARIQMVNAGLNVPPATSSASLLRPFNAAVPSAGTELPTIVQATSASPSAAQPAEGTRGQTPSSAIRIPGPSRLQRQLPNRPGTVGPPPQPRSRQAPNTR